MMRFSCPRCRARLKAGDQYGGRRFDCPRCGAPVTAPQPAKIVRPEKPPLIVLGQLARPPARGSRPRFGAVAGVMLAGVCLLTVWLLSQPAGVQAIPDGPRHRSASNQPADVTVVRSGALPEPALVREGNWNSTDEPGAPSGNEVAQQEVAAPPAVPVALKNDLAAPVNEANEETKAERPPLLSGPILNMTVASCIPVAYPYPADLPMLQSQLKVAQQLRQFSQWVEKRMPFSKEMSVYVDQYPHRAWSQPSKSTPTGGVRERKSSPAATSPSTAPSLASKPPVVSLPSKPPVVSLPSKPQIIHSPKYPIIFPTPPKRPKPHK